MGQALYRKYRSRSLDQIVGQEHVVSALRSALKQQRVSHAYLFTGPRGVGKTSIARILAHEINQLPYQDEQSHIDIIEIDAASNRGIDEIRDLREKVYVAPTTGKYKVYIIDEVHMLTPQAFNALLKTLEEPPAHVVFILATTEVHKLPATIISRTQRYTFRPADLQQLTDHLRGIAKSEKIKIDDESLALIAEHGDGSFRDSVGLLDQLGSGHKQITAAEVHDLLGIPSKQAITELLESTVNGQIADIAAQLQNLQTGGYQASVIAKQLGGRLRQTVLENQLLLPLPETLQLMTRLLEVPVSPDANRFLEIVLIGVKGTADAPKPAKPTEQIVPAPVEPPKSSVKAPAETKKSDKPKNQPKDIATPPPKTEKSDVSVAETSKSVTTPAEGAIDATLWPEVLAQLKKRYNTLYSIIRMAQPEFTDSTITLTFGFAFHQKRLNEAKNRTIVSEVMTTVYGRDIQLECHYDKNAKPAGTAPATTGDTDRNQSLDTVSNIFGGGELLES
jgi:DNA polymerase-3 subunit gamma/tau